MFLKCFMLKLCKCSCWLIIEVILQKMRGATIRFISLPVTLELRTAAYTGQSNTNGVNFPQHTIRRYK